MLISTTLKYLGNNTWLYKGQQGTALLNAADQPALEAIARDGGEAVAHVSARVVDGALTVQDVHSINATAADGRLAELPGDSAKLLLGAMAGAVFVHPVTALGAGLVYGEAVEKFLPPNPNANLEYAHEYNFDGSPYHQASNRLQVDKLDQTSTDQQRTALREQFRRSETRDAERLGPDGQPWGTPTRTAPNATSEWTRSPQPGEWLHTTLVQGSNGIETRIEKVVSPHEWRVAQDNVHADGKRLATTDFHRSTGWKLNTESGQMERFTLTSEQRAMGQLPPPLRNLRALDDAALQDHHTTNARTMEASLAGVKRLGQAAVRGDAAAGSDLHGLAAEHAQRFRQAASEVWATRRLMLERGLDLPDPPGHRPHAASAPAAEPELVLSR